MTNVGTIGHVDHGKTTLTAALTRVPGEGPTVPVCEVTVIEIRIRDEPEITPYYVRIDPPQVTYGGIPRKGKKGRNKRW